MGRVFPAKKVDYSGLSIKNSSSRGWKALPGLKSSYIIGQRKLAVNNGSRCSISDSQSGQKLSSRALLGNKRN
jgi:hypothetical protein